MAVRKGKCDRTMGYNCNMPNIIQLLDEILASKIAAGEVVERPSSVVKELVENSIDAGAKRITVEIQNGGKSLIRITDDGSGMSAEDAVLSLQRHATSKIKTVEDLFSINTLGFRGEALPSIASISKLELLTSDGTNSTLLIVDGGNVIDKKTASSPTGTTISVRDLFFNTPARLKYLKTDSTETNSISDIVSKLVISHPEIAFRLTINGRESISSSGNGDLLDSITSVYGTSFAKELVQINGNRVHGFISKPSATKFNREYQLFFVNGRFIKNFILAKSLEAAYSNLIPKERHPSAVLFIEVDPSQVDVNVHPSKKEIRFEKTKEITDNLNEIVKESLIDVALPQLISAPQYIRDQKWDEQRQQIWTDQLQSPSFRSDISSSSNAGNSTYQPKEESYLSIRPIFQLDNSYIICVENKDLILIDQHAAHERILYDKLSENKVESSDSQYLLIPEVLELSVKEFGIVQTNIALLIESGFDIEIFGKNSIRLMAIPPETSKLDLPGLISDMALANEEGYMKQIDNARDKIRKLVACHGAIKAGDPLSSAEMIQLVRDLYATTNPTTCPHGRPCVVRLDNRSIAKFFERNK